MEDSPWTLQFEQSQIKIHGPGDLVAILPYPVTEGGTLEAPSVGDSAYLMAAAPVLLAALQLLLSTTETLGAAEAEPLKSAIERAKSAIARATRPTSL